MANAHRAIQRISSLRGHRQGQSYRLPPVGPAEDRPSQRSTSVGGDKVWQRLGPAWSDYCRQIKPRVDFNSSYRSYCQTGRPPSPLPQPSVRFCTNYYRFTFLSPKNASSETRICAGFGPRHCVQWYFFILQGFCASECC